MKLLEQTEAIVFDAYGTLFDISSVYKRIEFHFGLHAQRFEEIWRGKQLEYTWLRALIGKYKPFSEVTLEALEYTCHALSLPISPEVTSDMMLHYEKLTVFEEIPSVLRHLNDSHSLAILSNADPSLLGKAVRYNDIERYFSHIISADQVKTFKTSPLVYELAESHLSLARDHICFISTNRWDIVGAKAFGLKNIWLNRHDAVFEQMEFQPDSIISQLTELI